MRQNGRNNRIPVVAVLIAIILALVVWVGHALIARPLIAKMYQGTAPGFLNDIIVGQNIHDLQYYLDYSDEMAKLTIISIVVFAILVILVWLLSRLLFNSGRMEWLKKHTEYIDALADKHIGLWIALSAAAGLFMELMIIRLHGSYFQLFAYFKNISLLSCFLGLGIGYSRGNSKPLLTPLVLPFISAQILLMYLLRFTSMVQIFNNPISEQLTMGIGQSELKHVLIVYCFISFVFIFNMLGFIPLGQLSSRLMQRQPNLVAYSWNLIGSLGGILLFTLLAYLWMPPLVWILIGGMMLMPFIVGNVKTLVPSAAALFVLLSVFSFPAHLNQYDVYSPYQKLTLSLSRNWPVVGANNTFFQRILDLREDRIKEDYQRVAKKYYSLPYYFKPSPARVLIVGSGTGNDIAAAIRSGAGMVDAVEIDPAIIKFGQQLHPEAPYQANNVSVIVNDARQYIWSTDNKYDLIVYGLLDSHTLLSGHSGGVRLDSYVYTVEAFREARQRLADGGMLSLSFATVSPSLGRKLFIMLRDAFDGVNPRVYQAGYDGAYSFIISNSTASMPDMGIEVIGLQDVTSVFSETGIPADQATDNWPYFYMPVKKYPVSYIVMLGILLLISIACIRKYVPGANEGLSLPCFFLGAGFMLIETKGITELALVYGSTWLVINVVIAGILVMAFLANLAAIKYGTPRPSIIYGLLACSLVIGIVLTYINRSGMSPYLNRILTPVILVLPLYFSGFAFSAELNNVTVAVALSSNLFGAMLGGILEYNSMYFGFRALYYLALIIYLLAFMSIIFGRRSR